MCPAVAHYEGNKWSCKVPILARFISSEKSMLCSADIIVAQRYIRSLFRERERERYGLPIACCIDSIIVLVFPFESLLL
jgi:hypothetical protein